MLDFDVIVIGGGHAGIEAACASARIGAKTALLTPSEDNIGELSCNPAIGGVGKGTLVKEIDALDGVMGRIIDKASIHSKMLNSSKGPAVWGPRAQADRELYKKAAFDIVSSYDNLIVVYGKAVDICFENAIFKSITYKDSTSVIFSLSAKTCVITTGTFLNGTIHMGDKQIKAGRMGEDGSYSFADALNRLNLPLGRLKTGTPPRVSRETIDFSGLELQEGDKNPVPFSRFTDKVSQQQIPCYITRTTLSTKKIIEDNLSLSAMYSGNISGVGPRYCPSIEDKVVRFAHKDQHQVFLEPEGLNSDLIYPNGISNSLPVEVQLCFLQTIPGLENAKIRQPGYAIEYDYINPKSLNADLSCTKLKNIYFAGQINGTTGYEEAAGQGLVAGCNAALYAMQSEKSFVLSRSEAYIGVMVDDLIEKGVAEPYRVFTSRSEYRLSIRQDNADERLTQKGIDVGLVSVSRETLFKNDQNQRDKLKKELLLQKLTPQDFKKINIHVNHDGKKRTFFDLIGQGIIDKAALPSYIKGKYSPSVIDQLYTEALYAPFLVKQERDIALYSQEKEIAIPLDIDYYSSEMSLSQEVRQKLCAIQPKNIAAAKNISGITPAAITTLMLYLEKKKRYA